MKPAQFAMLALGAAVLASTAFPASSRAEEQIACASEVPAARKGQGHWYYRIIDGRKCWYDGKPMMPKTSLYWPDTSTAEESAPEAAPSAAPSNEPRKTSAQPVSKPSTDGRNVSAQSPAIQSATAEPAAAQPAAPPPTMARGATWPAPAANEISFESRWLGLHSKN